MMVAAVSGTASTTNPQNPKTPSQDSTQQQQRLNPRRPPLLPSERDNNEGPKKPKSKQVSSRYMSPSSSTPRRYPSPLVSRNSTPLSNKPSPAPPKRSVSADRRRPVADLHSKLGNVGEVSAATKLLVTSTRSLSVSFQGEAFSLPISKTKVENSKPNLSNVRKVTPERKRPSTPPSRGGDQVANSKPIDQHRWPGRTRQPNSLSTSFDFTEDNCNNKKKLVGSGNVIRALKQSMIDEGAGPRGIAVSARFWQETNSRLRRLQDPGSPLSTSPAKKVVPPKFAQSKKIPSDCPFSSPRTLSSPVRGSIRGASPSKLMTSVGSSPSRGTLNPSVLSFAVDVEGKVGRIAFSSHFLRLLYNRHLQWRFVNARTEATLLVQKHSAEKNMWNAWITISDLRDSVTKKRHRLQLLRQKLKLASILKGQITCLEDWASLDKDHSLSLLGAIEALKASTLRLPVVGGAIADVQSVKDAIGSAVDVMHAMASSICSLLSKAEDMNSLVSELSKVIAKERALLEQCKDFLSVLAALQVKHCSLRTHILQLNRVPTA
ncbi:QWRF motif-containing protein 2 [Camellia lanceoleosa]|uniref:QWRF motif-containing protein 2 n=1 Tax=Camellia lanceoleosa TaxID=1840588 RepID=A0ACC0FP12_9ERIC|nr:QWRF motif-containing protein 2 [Camellia lanceoleosa]